MLAWLLGIVLISGGETADFQQSPVQVDSLRGQRVVSVVNKILHVDRVLIIGNKVTRPRIIERELSLKPGDTISFKNLSAALLWDKNKIYNLRLFNTVTVRALDLTNDHIDILVEVSERWYVFPAPIFELSDRNINEWWNNYNHDFSRINYGMRIYKNNFRGRNESLRLTAQFGYVRKFDLQYKIPNLDRKQKQGITLNFDYAAPRNIAYRTLDHKLVFLEIKEIVRKSFSVGVGYSYRKSFFETHSLAFNYRHSEILDTVLLLNPIYYNYNKNTQKFFSISYSFNSEHRDVVLYPTKGYQFTGYLSKTGLVPNDDVNQLEINLTYAKHWPLGNGLFLSNFSSAFWSNAQNQPYNTFNALGYRNQLVRGFENYVIEGPRFALNKTTFKKKLFFRSWTMDLPLEQFSYFPLAVYIKTFADVGYVENYPYYDENGFNQLFSNRLLTGLGFGLDVVTVYDLVLRFEYTFTPQNTNGAFFFNLKKEF